MATNDLDILQNSHYSHVQLEQSQKAPSTVNKENYFKQIISEPHPENKPLDANTGTYFTSSPERFMGEYETTDYTLKRSFIEIPNQIRLFHTRFVNKKATTATLCIVHGFGEHSGRWIDVKNFYSAL